MLVDDFWLPRIRLQSAIQLWIIINFSGSLIALRGL